MCPSCGQECCELHALASAHQLLWCPAGGHVDLGLAVASTLGSGLFIACIMTAAILLLGSIQISDKVCQAALSSLCSPARCCQAAATLLLMPSWFTIWYRKLLTPASAPLRLLPLCCALSAVAVVQSYVQS